MRKNKHTKNMNKKRIEYIGLMLAFLGFLFSDSLDSLWLDKDPILNAKIIENTENKALREENQELKKIIDFRDNDAPEYIISKIKYRDIYNFKEEITIYKGKEEGLKENMAVLSNKGLIGVISKVYAHSSLVRLITNQNSNISVKINETYGILKMQDKKLIVSNITNYDNVKKEALIYTSGIGNLPGNILIGTVQEINLDKLEIEKIIQVNPQTDLENINYVYIVGAK